MRSMDTNRKETVKSYFRNKAPYYDLVDNQLYWIFSDDLLWELLLKEFLDPFKGKATNLLDAGGGTGRWGLRVAQYLKSNTLIFDISPEMLAEAQKKIIKDGLQKSAEVMVGDLDKPLETKREFDAVISFHNALSFVDNPKTSVENIRRTMKKGAPFAMIVANKYHSLYFSVLTRKFGNLETNLKKSLVQFTDDVPPMHTFTPASLRTLLLDSGFADIRVFGFPISIYPNMEETSLSDNSKEAISILKDKKTYQLLLDIEKEACLNEEAAARGNMLLAIAVAR